MSDPWPVEPPTVDSYGATYQESTKKDSQADPQHQDKADCGPCCTDTNIETFEIVESHNTNGIIPNDTNKRKEHSTSEFQTLIHFVRVNVGTGILALPLAVKDAGLIVGGVSLLFLGVITTHCMLLLVDVAHALTKRHPQHNTLNYSQAAEVAVSDSLPNEFKYSRIVVKTAGVTVNIFLIITQFGFCCVYFVFIADNLNQVFCSAFGVSFGTGGLDAVHVWIAIIIVPVVVFCWIRNLESLAPLSLVANLCVAFSLSVILYEVIFSFVSTDPWFQAAALRPRNVTNGYGHIGGIRYVPAQFMGLALFFGNAMYSFEGIGIVLPLENKMKRPEHFKKVIWFGMSFVIVMYFLVGTLGYAVFGESTQGSITLNLEESYDRMPASIFFLVAKLYYAYAIFATFLLQFYVPMDFLEPPLNRAINKLKERFCGQLVFQFPDYHKILNTAFLLVFRTLIVLIIASFALALPDLGDLISLVGAIASSALALIFPSLLHILVFIKGDSSDQQNGLCAKLKQTLCVTKMEQTLWITRFIKAVWVMKDVLIMVLGLVGFALGTYASINGLVEYFKRNSIGLDSVCVNFYPH